MKQKPKSKKQVYFIEAMALILFVIGFALIVIGGVLQDNGYGDYWFPFVGLSGFFICAISSLALLMHVFQDAMKYEIEKKDAFYQSKPLSNIENLSKSKIQEVFINNKFQQVQNGYLKRKKFTFLKDSILYYVKTIDAIQIEEAIEEQYRLFDQINETSRNVCLILFIYKTNVNEQDLMMIKDCSKAFIIEETTLPTQSTHTSVIVLVDDQTYKGYYLAIDNKMNISIYAYTCRLLNQYFKSV